ncbi:MAG: hypothetical protein HZA50_00300 [Planctomycetes bacterium]|nr:hypothetical protein [Planctomycetota bacterium]
MKRKLIAGFSILIAGTVAALALFAGMEVKTDKENVVAGRLIGKWKTNAAISERLRGETVKEETVIFAEDASVAAKVPDKYAEALKQKQVYLAGTMSKDGKNYPFILIEHKGNPHIFYFREKGGDPMGDGESFNLTIAPAKDKAKDLLFIGGDFNNQPFTAFERVE